MACNHGTSTRNIKFKYCSFLILLIFVYHLYPVSDRYLSDISINIKKKEETQAKIGEYKSLQENTRYKPSRIEKYLMENLVELGYDKEFHNTSGCQIWRNESASEIHSDLQSYAKNLDDYNKAIKNFTEIPDLMESIQADGDHRICESVKVHPDGLKAFFTEGQLSYSHNGFIEPLTPPMRHHSYCWRSRGNLFRQDYIIHDFEAMCKTLKPTSKRIFIDIGASMKREKNPLLDFLADFKKFGFHFDHIYGFEIKPIEAKEVYEDMLPEDILESYHWINTGVSAGKSDKMNPLHSILRKFKKDDFVLVKLDIDTSSVELPLAMQLLEDDSLNELVDHFYFEHHVFLAEMARWWTRSMKGSIKDSLELFHKLRQKGVSSHFWI